MGHKELISLEKLIWIENQINTWDCSTFNFIIKPV